VSARQTEEQGREGAEGDRETTLQPPSAPEIAEAEATAEEKFGTDEPEQVFVCLTCKGKGRAFEYTAAEIAKAGGTCPRCLTARDLVPKEEAEDAPAATRPTAEAKMTVKCVNPKCLKQYAEKPKGLCECGSRLGFSKLK
jgi:hypothetical protein